MHFGEPTAPNLKESRTMPVAVALLPLVAGLSTGVLAVRKAIESQEGPVKEKAKSFVSSPLKVTRPFLFIVNGTGPTSNEEYEKANEHSFLSKLHKRVPNSEYLRGPDNGGLGVDDLVNALEQRLISYGLPAELHFAGWSRGGRIVIDVARRLQQKHNGIPIKAMYLLDAVDRVFHDGNNSSATIPENVRVCYHAIRNPNYAKKLQKDYLEESEKLKKLATGPVLSSPDRLQEVNKWRAEKLREVSELREKSSSVMPATRDAFGYAKGGIGPSIDFGNTGTKLNNSAGQCGFDGEEVYATTNVVGNFQSRLIIKKFDTSHAGMGGLPWAENNETDKNGRKKYNVTYLTGESEGSKAAIGWIEACMTKEGLFSLG